MIRRAVVALGGNALLRRGEPLDIHAQERNVVRAAAALSEMAPGLELVVTHGNGPQVGLLALQAAALEGVEPYPLDVLGAESDGMVGYLLERELRNRLPDTEIVTILSLTEIDPADAAFANPTKPIGPEYSAAEVEALRREHGWTMAGSDGGFRRTVASPEPRCILEIEAVRSLIAAGAVVVCSGGGGVPVARVDGALRGVEAVVDKDLSAALLAQQLSADALLLLTDVDGVYQDWGTPSAKLLRSADVDWLRQQSFAAGSMAPKVEAACRFAEATGGHAAIGALEAGPLLLQGGAGTVVTVAG